MKKKANMAFFGRDDLLRQMSELWQKRTSSLVTCRGRRRVGKSTLIEEFAKRSSSAFIKFEGLRPKKGMTNETDDYTSLSSKQLRILFDGQQIAAQRDIAAELFHSNKVIPTKFSIVTKFSIMDRSTLIVYLPVYTLLYFHLLLHIYNNSQ